MAEVVKKRYWNFIVYEDSAPEDWVGVLKRSHCMFAISPQHQPTLRQARKAIASPWMPSR